jgi:threonine dehydrogenase-like Zn-dependent dehydrogenase
MKAALMQDGRLWIDDVPEPQPGAGEVLVATKACGICGSDLHAVQHTAAFIQTSREVGGGFKLTTDAPVVLGHEFCAEIVAFGPDTKMTLREGDLVCSMPVLLRSEMVGLGYSDIAPGGFAEYMVLTEALIQAVPNGLPAETAALTEPMAVGLHAVNKANLSPEDQVLVVGCGPVGLAIIAVLSMRGYTVFASDFSPGRRTLAEQLGASLTLDPAVVDPLETQPWPQDGHTVIFECVGVKGMLDQLFAKAPRNTRIVVVGVCLETDASRPLIAINKELSLQFVLGYTPQEFSETLLLLGEGELNVSNLVTDKVPLAQVSDAFQRLGDPRTDGKIIVIP